VADNIDESCPVCGATDRELHHNPLAWDCTQCGTVWQDILQTDDEGTVIERTDTNILERGDE